MPKITRQKAEELCDKALGEKGFVRPRRGSRYWELNDNFLGWVGLNIGAHPEFVRINPFIGIHIVPVMERIASLEHKKYRKGDIATVALHLGEVAPDVPEFVFQGIAAAEDEAARLASIIYEYAVPWFQRHANYEVILEMLLQEDYRLGGIPERAAVTMVAMGQIDRAREYIRAKLSEYREAKSPYLPWFEPFSEALLADLATHDQR